MINPTWENVLFNYAYRYWNNLNNQFGLFYNIDQFRAIGSISDHLNGIPQRSNSAAVTSTRSSVVPHEQSLNFIDYPLSPINNKLVASLMIIGPPGTGKTEVISYGSILRIFEQLNLSRSHPSKLFIATQTNAGAYRVYEAFHKMAQKANTPDYYTRIILVQADSQIRTPQFNIFARQYTHDFYTPIRDYSVDETTWKRHFHPYLIFIGTVYSLASIKKYISGIRSIIYDEASQLTIPEFFLPIPDNQIRSITIVGDDKQLPPVSILTPLSTSIMTYIQGMNFYQNVPIPNNRKIELKTQYRMHPAIGQLTARIYNYQRNVLHGNNVKANNYLLQGYNFSFLPPIAQQILSSNTKNILNDILDEKHTVVILDLPNSTNQQVGSSRINQMECDLTLALVKSLLHTYRNYITKNDIIITSPYRAQSELISGNPNDLKVGTIHQFQGQESKIVIYNLTFAELNSTSKFFTQLNLMYVALSRAQNKLIVLGNKDELNHPDPDLQHVKDVIFNYQYQPRPNIDPIYQNNPVVHIRLDSITVNEIINALQ